MDARWPSDLSTWAMSAAPDYFVAAGTWLETMGSTSVASTSKWCRCAAFTASVWANMKMPATTAENDNTSNVVSATPTRSASPKATAPMRTLTMGSVADRVGSEASSGPAWKALWARTMPATPATARR